MGRAEAETDVEDDNTISKKQYFKIGNSFYILNFYFVLKEEYLSESYSF